MGRVPKNKLVIQTMTHFSLFYQKQYLLDEAEAEDKGLLAEFDALWNQLEEIPKDFQKVLIYTHDGYGKDWIRTPQTVMISQKMVSRTRNLVFKPIYRVKSMGTL